MKSTVAQRLRENLTITQVADKFDIPLSLRNGQGRCPFCGSSTAFSVKDDRSFYCYRCSASGSIFDLLIHSKKASNYSAAVKMISAAFNYNDWNQYQQQLSAREAIFNVYLEEAYIHRKVISNYFNSRGWSVTNNIGLSISKDTLAKHGIKNSNIAKAQLDTKYDSEYYDNHIIFPVYNQRGHLSHFCGRALDDREVRWKSSKGDPPITKHFYNSRELYTPSSEYLFVCEGISDGLSLGQLGHPYIAQFGIHVPLVKFAEQFSKFDYLIFCYDRDKYALGSDLSNNYKSWGPMLPKIIELMSVTKKPTYCLMPPDTPGIKDLNDFLLSFEYNRGSFDKYGREHCYPIEELAIKVYQNNQDCHNLIWKALAASDNCELAEQFLAQQGNTANYLLSLHST